MTDNDTNKTALSARTNPARIEYVQKDNNNTLFPFPFLVLNKADIRVGLNGQLLEADQYRLHDVKERQGANIEFNQAPAINDVVVLWRETSAIIDTVFVEGGDIRAASLNAIITRLTLLQQDFHAMLDRCLQNTPLDGEMQNLLPRPQAGKALIWNENNNGFVNSLYHPDAAEAAANQAKDQASQAGISANKADLSAKNAADHAKIAIDNALQGHPSFYGFKKENNHLLYTHLSFQESGDFKANTLDSWFFALSGIDFSMDDHGHLIANYHQL